MESINHCPVAFAYIEALALKQGENMPFRPAVAALQQVESAEGCSYVLAQDLRVSPSRISGL
jgi:hypothetical protein